LPSPPRLAGWPALGAADAEFGRRQHHQPDGAYPRRCAFRFLTLITMRGDYGEFQFLAVPMGQGTPKVLEAMGVLLYSVDKADEVKATVDAAARAAFHGARLWRCCCARSSLASKISGRSDDEQATLQSRLQRRPLVKKILEGAAMICW